MACGGSAPTFNPDTTAGVTVAQLGDTGSKVTINYRANPGDTGWVAEIYRGLAADPVPGTDSPISSPSIDPALSVVTYNDLGLVVGNTYHYIVRIKCGSSSTTGETSVVDKYAVPATHIPVSDVTAKSPLPTTIPIPVDPKPPPTGEPHKNIDELIWLVKPTKTASGYTFTDLRVLSATYQRMEWWYYRNGGCGHFRLFLRENFAEKVVSVTEGYEVHVRIKLPGETSFTTWYRGVIRHVDVREAGNEIQTEIRGQGYLEQLNSIMVQRRYPKGQTVYQIVNDIIDNYVKPNSRIIRPSDRDPTNLGNGTDASGYLTQGPIHFECTALKALKFLAELQGDREWGVDALRQWYFRATSSAVGKVLFHDQNLINQTNAGREQEKINTIKVEGKQWGHRETLKKVQDITDVTKYGLFERAIEVPWLEHDNDSVQWANNIIAKKKGNQSWRVVEWNDINQRIEDTHPIKLVRVYGSDVSSDFESLLVGKIKYTKGGLARGQRGTIINEFGQPREGSGTDQVELRATLYLGQWHKDLFEEIEEKVFDQLSAIKAKHKQFRSPGRDCTHPNPSDISLWPGMLWALPTEPQCDVTDATYGGRSDCDITNSRYKLTYWDNTRWMDVVGMRTDVTLPKEGDFLGEERFLFLDVTRCYGQKYYWAGHNRGWKLMETDVSYVDSKAGTGGGVSLGTGAPSQIDLGDAAQAGVLTTAAPFDHQHPFPAPTVAKDVTNSNIVGTGTKAATEDHQHRGILAAKIKGQADIFGYIDVTTTPPLKGSQSGQTITLSSDVPTIAQGGTGQTTKTAAFDALSPLTTKGDLIAHDGTSNIRVAVGSNNQVLTADSAQTSGVKWAASSAAEAAANTVLRSERFS